jgi:hypothetical protein
MIHQFDTNVTVTRPLATPQAAAHIVTQALAGAFSMGIRPRRQYVIVVSGQVEIGL